MFRHLVNIDEECHPAPVSLGNSALSRIHYLVEACALSLFPSFAALPPTRNNIFNYFACPATRNIQLFPIWSFCGGESLACVANVSVKQRAKRRKPRSSLFAPWKRLLRRLERALTLRFYFQLNSSIVKDPSVLGLSFVAYLTF